MEFRLRSHNNSSFVNIVGQEDVISISNNSSDLVDENREYTDLQHRMPAVIVAGTQKGVSTTSKLS